MLWNNYIEHIEQSSSVFHKKAQHGPTWPNSLAIAEIMKMSSCFTWSKIMETCFNPCVELAFFWSKI